MKIVIVSSYDVSSRDEWSGIPYYCTSALRQVATELVIISPLEPRKTLRSTELLSRAKQRNLRYLPDRDLDVLRARGHNANKILKHHRDADLIVIFHPPDAAFLETLVPIVVLHDATWGQFTSSYPRFAPESFDEVNFSHALEGERMAFTNSRGIVFFTDWAADAARHEYSELASRIAVALPGANLDIVPTRDAVNNMIASRGRAGCRIIHVGKEFHRKGADIALGVLQTLLKGDSRTTLHLAGVNLSPAPPSCSSYGLLSKDPGGCTFPLHELYSSGSVFLFPTRAECAGIVLCEAAAFGLPVFTSGIGGTKDIVVDQLTGHHAGTNEASDYAAAIGDLLLDTKRYLSWSHAARDRYESDLNWQSTIRCVCQQLGLSS
jgi:glycosyltransferase involved in cell wall biosynthesis